MMLRKIVDMFFLITFVVLICGLVDQILNNRLDAKRYIDKSKCIGLPSSDVNEYWACKKEVKK